MYVDMSVSFDRSGLHGFGQVILLFCNCKLSLQLAMFIFPSIAIALVPSPAHDAATTMFYGRDGVGHFAPISSDRRTFFLLFQSLLRLLANSSPDVVWVVFQQAQSCDWWSTQAKVCAVSPICVSTGLWPPSLTHVFLSQIHYIWGQPARERFIAVPYLFPFFMSDLTWLLSRYFPITLLRICLFSWHSLVLQENQLVSYTSRWLLQAVSVPVKLCD